jgi:hypothetical protein
MNLFDNPKHLTRDREDFTPGDYVRVIKMVEQEGQRRMTMRKR